MPTQIQIKRGSSSPSGLTQGEFALNTSTNQVWIGGTAGSIWVGGEVTGGVDMGSGAAVSQNRVPTQNAVYQYTRGNFVASFNGLTGAVGGVTTSAANTFTALQTFSSGISANGGTFSVQLNAQNFRALTVGGDEGGQIEFGLPATNTTLSSGVAIDVYQNRLRIFETGGTNRGVFVDLSGVSAGVATNLIGGGGGAVSSVSGSGNGISVSPTTGAVIVQNTGVHSFNGLTGAVTGVTVGGTNTFTALNTFSAGLCAAGGITFNGAFTGVTASFSRLVSFTAGLSGNGITLSGNLSAATKSFVIPHPTKRGMRLQYASLEGPENGVYVRGRTEEAVIVLPDYWTGLVHSDSITVNLTPIGSGDLHWVKSIKGNKVKIASASGTINCFYTVYAERKDVPRLQVEG